MKAQRHNLRIQFRECNWNDLWLWFEFDLPPGEGERQYLEQVLDSWYSLGMLGGFNATSLQVQDGGVDISYMDYETETDALPALMHNISSVAYQGNWARCWVDLGTADALAIDVLLNALIALSEEYISLKQVFVGGVNDNWPTNDPNLEDPDLEDPDDNGDGDVQGIDGHSGNGRNPSHADWD